LEGKDAKLSLRKVNQVNLEYNFNVWWYFFYPYYL